MHVLFLTILLLLIIVNSAKSYMDSCRQTFGSNKYDLNRLNSFTLFASDDQYDYAINPCAIVPPDACHTHTVPNEMSCQYQRAFHQWSTMSFVDGQSPWPPNANATFTENPDGSGTGIFMTTSNGDPCFGSIRYMRMKFICDKTIDQPSNISIVEWLKCDFHVEIRAAQACPIE